MPAKEAPDHYRLYTDAEIMDLPPPEWLIEGILPAGGLVQLYGAPGIGKTFLALDWVFCIGTGTPWLGRSCMRGRVVYIAAEGRTGLGPRIRAWRVCHGHEDETNVSFVAEPVYMLKPKCVKRLLRTLETLDPKPSLIVIDTMARCIPGADESAAKDVGLFIAHLDSIRLKLGVTILVIHHIGKDKRRKERGSTAFRGAADTMISLKKDGEGFLIECDKQKESEPFDEIGLKLVKVDLPDGKTSLVVDECTLEARTGGLSLKERKALETLAEFESSKATATEWCRASNLAVKTFYRCRKFLEKGGYVSRPGLRDRGEMYTITQKGKEAVNVT